MFHIYFCVLCLDTSITTKMYFCAANWLHHLRFGGLLSAHFRKCIICKPRHVVSLLGCTQAACSCLCSNWIQASCKNVCKYRFYTTGPYSRTQSPLVTMSMQLPSLSGKSDYQLNSCLHAFSAVSASVMTSLLYLSERVTAEFPLLGNDHHPGYIAPLQHASRKRQRRLTHT